MIKLGVFDLDKTLLDINGDLPADFYENVEKLSKQGCAVAIASGRPANFLRILFKDAPDNLYICGEDGNVFFKGMELLHARFIPWSLISEVQEVISARDDIAAMYSTLGDAYVGKADLEKLVSWGFGRFMPMKSHELRGDEEIVRIHLICRGGEEAARRAVAGYLNGLAEKYDVLEAGFGWIGVMEKGNNKGGAVHWLMEKLDAAADQVAVFGDSENDVPMFSVAKYAYAMKNAAPVIQAKAAFITKYDHTENGAMRQLMELAGVE